MVVLDHVKLNEVWGKQNYHQIPISNVLHFRVNGLKDKFWTIIFSFQVKVFFCISKLDFFDNLRFAFWKNWYVKKIWKNLIFISIKLVTNAWGSEKSCLSAAGKSCAGTPGLRPTFAFVTLQNQIIPSTNSFTTYC